MSLRAILRLVYSIVLVIVILGGVAYWAVNTLGQSAKELERLSVKKASVADLQLAFANVVMPGNDYLITGSPEERNTHTQLDRIVQNALAGVQQTTASARENKLVDKIARQYEQVRKIELQILVIADPIGNLAGAKQMEEWMQL